MIFVNIPCYNTLRGGERLKPLKTSNNPQINVFKYRANDSYRRFDAESNQQTNKETNVIRNLKKNMICSIIAAQLLTATKKG